MLDTCDRIEDMPQPDTPDRLAAIRRQLQRRSNSNVPIPMAQHKRSRSWDKQQLREEWR